MTTKRGRVLRGTNTGPGLLTVEGRQYSFTLEGMWTSEVPPQPGMTVDVQFENDTPARLSAISDNQIAKEQAAVTLEAARRQGSAAAATILARVGGPTLAGMALLVLGWFFLAFLDVNTGLMNRSETLWQLLSFLGAGNPIASFGGDSSAGGAGSGLYELLAVASLGGPFLSYIWGNRIALAGYLLPLLFMTGLALDAALSLRNAVPNTGNDLTNQLAQEAFDQVWKALSLGFGAYVSVAASLWLAAIGVKQFLVRSAGSEPARVLANDARSSQG